MSTNSKMPSLSELETDRKRQYARSRTFFFLVFIGSFILMSFRTNSPDTNDIITLILFAAFFGICAFMISTENFGQNLRKKVFPAFIKSLWPEATHDPFNGISQHEFEASEIFLYEINSYTSSNLIQARSDKTEIKLSSVHAAYHPYGEKGTATIFSGLFLIAEFNKNTKGRTYVLPDKAERLLGKSGQDLQSLKKSHGKLVKTEDPEFEHYFVVHSSDQVEARYILSPSFMRNLLEFRKAVENDVFVSFIAGKMYLGLSNGTLTHRLSVLTPLTADSMKTLSPHLLAIHRLIDQSLTTHIWTKE